MELRFTKRNQTLIAHISGEIDHHTSGELRLKIDRALEQISGKNIIFCFREVTFMDSSGIGLVMGRYRLMQELGGELRVTGVPAGIELLTFPSQIEISYLIPMSLYSVDDEALHAVADYSSLLTPSGALSPKLAVKLPILPTFYHNVSLSVDSVEYIIEQKAPAQ